MLKISLKYKLFQKKEQNTFASLKHRKDLNLSFEIPESSNVFWENLINLILKRTEKKKKTQKSYRFFLRKIKT